MTLAERIKALRKGRGMTQEQLADYLHISPQAISKWETAQSSPDVDMLPKLAIGEERAGERIEIGERLIEATRDDAIKYDALRLLAQTYHRLGENAMAEHYLSQIPELYFLRTEIASVILSGKEQEKAIAKTEKTCFGILLAMCLLSREGKAAGCSEGEVDKLEELLIEAYALLFGQAAAKGMHEKYQDKSLLDAYH